jgi:hypothetical protein
MGYFTSLISLTWPREHCTISLIYRSYDSYVIRNSELGCVWDRNDEQPFDSPFGRGRGCRAFVLAAGILKNNKRAAGGGSSPAFGNRF